MKGFLVFVLSLLWSTAVTAQSEEKQLPDIPTDNPFRYSIDSIVHHSAVSYYIDGHPVGLSIGIVKESKVYTYNYGQVKKGQGKLPSDTTLYPIASLSKTFTAALLAQAVIEKKLSLDDDVRKYLPGNYPNLAYQGHPIQLKHLTNHRSMLPFLLPEKPEVLPGHNNEAVPWPTRIAAIYKDYTRNDFYKDLRQVQLDTVPGNNFRYSNTAVQLLCYVLEQVYNKPFETLLFEKLTSPLEMNQTRITIGKGDSALLAVGYDEKGRVIPYTPDILLGAGSIKSTVSDLLKYVQWNLKEDNNTVALVHRTIWGDSLAYATGLNWQKMYANGSAVIWQEGNIPGFNSYCVIYPNKKMGIVVLSNESDRFSSGLLTKMINRIMKRIDPHLVSLP